MKSGRIIPFLMLHKGELYKSTGFKNFRYIGDPLVAMKIFNEKEAQEICLVDIDPSRNNHAINFELLKEIAGECFMPLAYGGGIKTLEDARKIIYSGFEKIIVNTHAIENPHFIKELIDEFGSSTIVLSLDYKKSARGNTVFTRGGTNDTHELLTDWVVKAQEFGVGEILLSNIDRDGKMIGQDLEVLRSLVPLLKTPCISLGGVGSHKDIASVLQTGIDSVAASSLFVYKGPLQAVLINYPEKEIVKNLLNY